MLSMRELHSELLIKTPFRHWVKRKLSDFTDGVDFKIETHQGNKGGRPRKDYYASIDVIKKIRESYSLANSAKIHAEREHGALCAIELLLGIKLERQFKVGKYRIDGYHKESNTAYEIDEKGHKYKIDSDKERQAEIEKELECVFVRIPV